MELREVVADLSRDSRSVSSSFLDICTRYSVALAEQPWKHSAMVVGWMPLRKRSWAAPKKEPANTTTDVVPSPASMSWAADRSTSILAAGWRTDMCFRMVAPSLEMMTPWLPVLICVWEWVCVCMYVCVREGGRELDTTRPTSPPTILSMPRGPREVLTASATAAQGGERGWTG